MQANTHILTDTATGKIAVVDAGDCTDALKERLCGKQVEYILLTHGHFDHILGVAALKALTGAEICIHAADADSMKIFPIKLKRRTVRILEVVSSIVAFALFAWIDRRLVAAMMAFEFSNVMSEYLRK